MKIILQKKHIFQWEEEKALKTIKNSKKNNKGITLIALIVTIIVLLILAGVAIAMLRGENRYFK